MAPPKAVLFDVDGTLVDTVDLHAQAWVEALQHFGVEADFTDIRLQIGKGGDQFLPGLIPPDMLEERGEEIQEFRSDLFKRKYMSQVRPFSGVRELFERIRSSGQKIVLASSGPAEEVETHKATANIADLIDDATTADDAERSKPFPDIFEAAFGKLGLSGRSDAMVVGDTPSTSKQLVRPACPPSASCAAASPSSRSARQDALPSTATRSICSRATTSRRWRGD
jgi:beta-phosphoglucomutase-like phosphatase (HAD superfamily)